MDGTWFDYEGMDTETLLLPVAMSFAIADRLGIRGMINDACEYDGKQRILSPGDAAMAIMGTMFTCNQKDALRNVGRFYSGSPVDLLFGARVKHESLSDTCLGRALDTIFDAGTEDLFFRIASRAKFELGLFSPVHHVDPSNITIHRSPGDEYGDLPDGAPVPKLGHPKDGSSGRVQYNFVASVDGNGVPELMMPYDGNTDDTVMISEAVKRLEELVGDERIIAVGDSKMVTKATVSRMCDKGTFFVSKPPMRFDDDVKHRVIGEALEKGFKPIGRIGKKKGSPELEVYETAAVSYGIGLRYIAYRKVDRSRIVRHMERLDGIAMEGMVRSMSARSFDTEFSAKEAHRAAVAELGTNAFRSNPTFRCRRSSDGGKEWKVSYKPVFDREYAERLAERQVEVIVTNLPGGEDSTPDAREGASASRVLCIYFGQWHVEGMFGELKSGMGADDVFLEKPSREAVMLFLMSSAALVRFTVKMLLRNEYGKGFGIPKNITAQRLYLLMQNVHVDYDRPTGRLRLTGSPGDRAEAMSYIRALGIDPVHLL